MSGRIKAILKDRKGIVFFQFKSIIQPKNHIKHFLKKSVKNQP